MLSVEGIHHIAIICTDYERSKAFYTEVLGLQIIREVYRQERASYKLDLSLNDQYVRELFSFPKPATRPSFPEASGLRHLAFRVKDIDQAVRQLEMKKGAAEPVRVDPYTGKKFTFFQDPDGLPLELYED